MSEEFLNGVRNYYGPRTVENLYGATTKMLGHKTQLEYVFSHDNLPVVQSSGAAGLVIPAFSLITSAYLYAIDGLLTADDLVVGLYDNDGGGAIDADGLITAVTATDTLLATGLWVVGVGAMVADAGTLTSLDEDAQIVVAQSGTASTAGKFRLLVEYIQPKAD